MKKLFFVLAVVASATAYAAGNIDHSGGTDAMGCHTDHRTGIWHCH